MFGNNNGINLDMRALEEALGKIEEVSNREETFDVAGISVTLRMVHPDEEVEVQQWAAIAIADEKDQATFAQFLDRIKIGMLSHVIVAIAGQSFRGEYVVTGEKLENGKPVRLLKHQFLREKLTKWTRPFLHQMFKKFGEIAVHVELDAENAIHFDPPDFDLEIERLEARVKELRQEKEEKDSLQEDFRAKIIKSAMDIESLNIAESIEEQLEQGNKIQEASNPSVVKTQQELQPEEVPPETPAPQQPANTGTVEISAEEYAEFKRQQIVMQQQLAQQDQEESRVNFRAGEVIDRPEDQGSFLHSNDPNTQAAAIQQENRRLLRERHQASQQQQSAPQEVRRAERYQNVAPVPSGRRPPHLAAAQAAQTVGQPVGTLGGMKVFDPSALGQSSEPNIFEAAVESVDNSRPGRPLDPTGDDKSRNPNFKPPQGR